MLAPKLGGTAVQNVGCENLLSMVAQGFGIALATNSAGDMAYPGVRFVPIADGEDRFWFSRLVWDQSKKFSA